MIIGGVLGVITVFGYAPPATIIAAVNLTIIGAISGSVVGGLSGLIVEFTFKRTRKPTKPDPAEDTD